MVDWCGWERQLVQSGQIRGFSNECTSFISGGVLPRRQIVCTQTSMCDINGGRLAISTERIIDAGGVNAHLAWTDTIYWQNWPLIKRLLVESGIRHVRTGATEQSLGRLEELAEYGIDFLIVDSPLEAGHAAAKRLNSGGVRIVDAVEPPNEKDGQWAMLCEHQEALWNLYKNDPATADIKVLSPSLANWTGTPGLIAACPSIRDHADVGNVHDYSGTAPELPTGGGYGRSMVEALEITTQLAGDETWSTENGYTMTANPWTSASELGAAKYVLRQILLHVMRGSPRVYFYELIDYNGNENEYENFGLVNYDGTPRMQYNAIRAFNQILAGGDGSDGALNYSLDGTGRIAEVLMTKGNGTFVLALWNPVPVTGGPTRTDDIRNEPIPMTLQLPGSANVRQFLPSTHGTEVVGSSDGVSSVDLEVPDEVLLVEISGLRCGAVANDQAMVN